MAHTQLGKYEVLEEIGSGGFATVYRALDTTLDREVALKVLDPLLMRDDAFVDRFQREARAAASLEHPNIVPIYEVDEGDGRLFIAMRLVRGPSLAERLEADGRITWEETLAIIRPVCDALAYAHGEGVVHRDIKPHNILLDERSGAMLTDFGFARLVGTSSLTQSISGGIVGTPAYIAPEIWEGVDATPATDVYALACVTYEVLTGEVLFKGKTPMTVMRAHDRGAEVTEEWPIDVPAGVEEVIAQALTRVPAVRYSSISVFLKALEDLQTAAVEQRIADRVNQMLEEMRTALDTGRFEQAVAVGKDLIELKPNHEAGARLLGEAQARLSEKCKLEEHLEEKQTSLEAERKELLSEKSELTDYVAILEKRIGNLSAERAELEAQLKKLKQIQVRSESDKAEMLQSLEAVEKRLIELRKYSERLDAVSRFLTNGDLKHSRQLLKQPRTPNSDLQEVTEKFDKGADTAETSTNSAKQQVEESDEGAIVWVVVALLVIFVTIIVGQAIGTS